MQARDRLRAAIVTYRHPFTFSRSFHDFGEDEQIVASGLSERGFDVSVTSMEELRDVTRDEFNVIYVSNISPDSGEEDAHFFEERKRFYARAEKLKLPIYNGLEADRDRNGKEYLVPLFKQGHEVIPTVDSLSDFGALPVAAQYISKPKLGFSSRGCMLVNRGDISHQHFAGRIVQPFYSDIAREVSVYVIDGKSAYATSCPSKFTASGWEKLKEHVPTDEENRLALKFTRHVENGLVRLDLLRLADASLKLLEIEDNSPYCALPEAGLSAETKVRALDALASSLTKRALARSA